jgi:hypothetical protein
MKPAPTREHVKRVMEEVDALSLASAHESRSQDFGLNIPISPPRTDFKIVRRLLREY